MKNFNNRLHYLFYAIAIVFGIWIGVSTTQTEKRQTEDKKLNEILNYIKDNYVEKINDDTLLELTINSLLSNLDPHSAYISKEEFTTVNELITGSFEGIGVQFRIEKDTVVVIQTIPNGPSEKVGILAGDRIVEVNGEKIAGVGIKNEQVMRKLKGPRGTKVTVGIKRRNFKNLLKFTITRDVIPTKSIDYADIIHKDIGYIKLSNFSLQSDVEFYEALEKLLKKGMKKLILDLRGNGGGSLQSCVDILEHFLPKKTLLVYTEGHNRKRVNYYTKKQGKFIDGKLVVLIDEFSASASEIIAGAIQDHERGIIIGRRSFGKGLVQEQINLKDGSAIRLTVARYYTPLGRCIQRDYKKGLSNYYEEFYSRVMSEYKEGNDNTKEDTVKYYTKSGKVLYGGGGIKPDIHVSYPKIYSNDSLKMVFSKIFQFAFEYADNNRSELKKQYSSAKNFIAGFQVSDKLWEDFINYIKQNSSPEELKTDLNKINPADRNFFKVMLKANIGRNLYDYEAYYPIIADVDEVINEAIKVLSK